jgi:hypothetical protein
MKAKLLLTLPLLLTLSACAEDGKAGDSCTSDDDCGDGLHCHIEHDEHDEDEHEEEDHEEEGVCEEEDAHDEDDH